MDAGLAALGHGWHARSYRLFQVTRRKGETASSRYRRNGYVHDQRV